MATTKQINFIETLIARTGGAGQNLAAEYTLRVNGQIDDLSTKQASKLISELLELSNTEYTPAEPKPVATATEKQISFINDLVAQVGEKAEEYVARYDLDALPREEASELIDYLLFLRRIASRKAA